MRRLIAAIRQRLADAAREVRIKSLSAAVLAEKAAGRHDLAREAWGELISEIEQRSPEQVARMERRLRKAL